MGVVGVVVVAVTAVAACVDEVAPPAGTDPATTAGVAPSAMLPGGDSGDIVDGGSGGAEPRPSAHAHATVDRASGGCSGPTNAFTSAVLVPMSCDCGVAAPILGNCHSYTVATSRVGGRGTPSLMN